MERWHELESNAILKKLETDPQKGLSQQQAEERLSVHGKNAFVTKKKTSLVRKILYQLQDVSVIVLLIATGLSFLLAIREGAGFIEPAVILAIVVLNVILAITQEGKAEKALEALEDLNAPTCVVLRDGMPALEDVELLRKADPSIVFNIIDMTVPMEQVVKLDALLSRLPRDEAATICANAVYEDYYSDYV